MAEGILKDKVLSYGRFDFVISSMGIHGLDFKPASLYAISVCKENGIDIGSHLSRPLFPEDLRGANLIFAIEPLHKEFINTFFPSVIDRVFLLGCWPAKDTSKGVIADPIGGTIEKYRKTFNIIQKHIDRIVGSLFQMYPPENH